MKSLDLLPIYNFGHFRRSSPKPRSSHAHGLPAWRPVPDQAAGGPVSRPPIQKYTHGKYKSRKGVI